MSNVISWQEFRTKLNQDQDTLVPKPDHKQGVATDLLQVRWNRLKDRIEKLKPFAARNTNVVKKIRQLKNESHVIFFALEKVRRGEDHQTILEEMKEDRKFYQRIYDGAQ